MIDFQIPQIAQELRLAQGQVAATVSLLDDGATVPFIARYRKENTARVALINPFGSTAISRPITRTPSRRVYS